jgi:acyl-CoA synthetase (AMP-forming)/AMP-acid ligase II
VFAPNIPAMYELHFGIPMAGAVICALNSRLNAAMASVLLQHS